MQTRRAFLKSTGKSALGAALLSDLAATNALARSPAPEASGQPALAGLSQFGRMFPQLRPLQPDQDPNVTVANLSALATTMRESIVAPNPDDTTLDITQLGAIQTYMGQFIDHDLTLDRQPQPISFIDPTTLTNFETFVFDLSSVYGGGPQRSPQLYNSDGLTFKIQEPNANGVRDLPRNGDGSAVLFEARNDENEIISQVHVGFLKFHNAVVALRKPQLGNLSAGFIFALVQREVQLYYQWAVLHDFLPKWVGQDVVNGYLSGSLPSFYNPSASGPAFTPVEWSTVAYRFGHSAVRRDYELNEQDVAHNIFDGTDNDLHGGRPLPAGRQVDWGDFITELEPAGADNFQKPRLIDTHISDGVFALPIGGLSGAEASGSTVLPFRNMVRGFFYGLPSGQDIAKALGLPVIAPNDAIDPSKVPGFKKGTPAWYYGLKEAEQAGGQKLGALQARIVTDVFVKLMQTQANGLLTRANAGFVPVPPIAPSRGTFRIADMFVFAGVATRP